MMQTKVSSAVVNRHFNWGFEQLASITSNFDFSFFMVGFHGFDIYNATHQMGFNTVFRSEHGCSNSNA